MNHGHALWHIAFLLVSVFTVVIGYYDGIIAAAVFWIVATLVLVPLRPE